MRPRSGDQDLAVTAEDQDPNRLLPRQQPPEPVDYWDLLLKTIEPEIKAITPEE